MQISDLEKTPVWARTLSFLVLSGVVGGFFLSAGAAEYVSIGKKHRAPAKQGQGGRSGGHDIQENRGQAGAGGPEQDGGEETPIAQSSEPPRDKVEPPRGLAGKEAAAFLAGKTIRNTNRALAPYIYFAERGLRADGDEQGAVVRRWTLERDSLCETTEQGGADCHDIELTAFDMRGRKTGDVVGSIRTERNGKLDILMGNVIKFPEIIPMMDGARPDTMQKFQSGGAVTGSGESVVKLLVGKPLLSQGRRLAGSAPVAVVYDSNNRYVNATPTAGGDANAKTWLQVAYGSWNLQDNALCQETADTSGPVCFTPEARGPGAFRLVPVERGLSQDYVMLVRPGTVAPAAAAKGKPAAAAAKGPTAESDSGGFAVVR